MSRARVRESASARERTRQRACVRERVCVRKSDSENTDADDREGRESACLCAARTQFTLRENTEFMQTAPKLETLKGLKLGHLPTVGRRALGGSYDL